MAINIHVRFPCEPKFSFLWDKYAGVQFLGNKVIAYLTSKKLSNCLPQWLYHFTFPISIVWMTQFFHIFLSIFYFSHSDGVLSGILFWFNLHFPNTQWCWIFSCVVFFPHLYFLWWSSFYDFRLCSNCVFFFLLWSYKFYLL